VEPDSGIQRYIVHGWSDFDEKIKRYSCRPLHVCLFSGCAVCGQGIVLWHHVKKPRLIIIGLCLASQSLCTKPVVVDGAQLTTLVEFTVDAELYVDEIVYLSDTAHVLLLFHSQ
jgi:hypothetical protein